MKPRKKPGKPHISRSARAAIAVLRSIIKPKVRGAQTKFARKHRLSKAHLNNVLKGRRGIGKKLGKVLANYKEESAH